MLLELELPELLDTHSNLGSTVGTPLELDGSDELDDDETLLELDDGLELLEDELLELDELDDMQLQFSNG